MNINLFKKLVSSLVIACLLFSSYGVALAASTSVESDIKGHWAEAQLSEWMDKRLIKGYEDGIFKPDHNITRAEFIALVNRSFGFTEEIAISFSDVLVGNWAYPEISKAFKAGYITGYIDGTVGVNKTISRQEVAAIVDRLLKPANTERAATTYTDSASIASWAKGSVDTLVARGIMKGYEADNSFKPAKSITRGEAVVTLDRAINAQAVVYDKAGTYGPATGVETINANVDVQVAGVTMQNMVINGDLLLGEGIGNGDAFLNNVKVTGTVTVQGGGENSIHFNNSVLIDVIIDKKSGTGIVRIVSEGSTTIALVVVNSPATIQENNSTSAGFGNVNISSALPVGSKVTLAGSFNTVNISSKQIIVDVPKGSIQTVNVNSTATGMELSLSQGAKINLLVLNAAVKMLGQGTIVAAVINTPGTTFEKPAGSTTGPTAPIAPPTAPSTAPPTAPPTTVPPTTVPPTAPPEVKKGTVTGSVYKYISQSEPIVGATVSVYSGVEGSGTIVGTVQSGPDGKYSISNVTVGNYYLVFAMTDYLDVTITPTNHTVSENAITDASKAYMYRNLVKGYVKDSGGIPISNFIVRLYDDEDYDVYDEYTQTGDDGAFYFYDVPETDYLYVSIDSSIYESSGIKVDSVSTNEVIDIGTIEFDRGNDRRLSSFDLSGITFSPTFSPNETNYTASVPYNVSSTIVSATTMNPNATISDGRLGEQPLRVGYNSIQVYVSAENDDYYTYYQVSVYREPAADQVTAIAKIEAVTDTASADAITIDDLNTATGENIALEDNLAAYKKAIVAAVDGELNTWDEISQLIYEVNRTEAIAKIEAVTDTDSADLITINELIIATESDRPIEENLLAYRLAIKSATDGKLNTSSKIFDLVSRVNTTEAIAKIEAVTDADSADAITIRDLYSATNKYSAREENLSAYKEAIAGAADGALDTSDKISSMVVDVNNDIF